MKPEIIEIGPQDIGGLGTINLHGLNRRKLAEARRASVLPEIDVTPDPENPEGFIILNGTHRAAVACQRAIPIRAKFHVSAATITDDVARLNFDRCHRLHQTTVILHRGFVKDLVEPEE